MTKKIILESIINKISNSVLKESVTDRFVKNIHRVLVNQFKNRKNFKEKV